MRQDEDVVTHSLGRCLSFLLLLLIVLTRRVLRVKGLLGHIHLHRKVLVGFCFNPFCCLCVSFSLVCRNLRFRESHFWVISETDVSLITQTFVILVTTVRALVMKTR